MGLGATYRIERPRRRLRLRRRSRRLADARADAVHAPRIGARQPAGAADPSRPGLHAHHDGRAARRRRNRPDDVRGLGVSRRGARPGRQPLQHRDSRRSIRGRRGSAGIAARGRRSSRADTCTSPSGSSRTTRRRSPRRSSSTARSASRPLAATLAWGHHREDNGFNDHADGYLLEWDLRATDRTALYGRARSLGQADLRARPPSARLQPSAHLLAHRRR